MSYAEPKADKKEAIRIVLKPARSVRVKVVTDDGKPAAGVMVQALCERNVFPNSRTDHDGQAAIRVLPDANVQWVIAWKDDLGLDYYENYRSWPAIQTDPLPATVALRLHKACRVRVRTIDSADRPVAGVAVVPWTLKIPGKLSYVNFSGCSLSAGLSDSGGNCDFAWLPADANWQVGFESFKPGYNCPDQPHWDPAQPQAPVTFRLLKDAEVSGTVRFPDGKPAAGIAILGEGRGATNMYFRGSTTTDADGHYRLGIYPRQSTIVAVADRDWAAASHTGVQLNEGKTREHLDFVLSRGTRIHGRVTVGPDGKSVSKQIVTLIEQGEPLGEDARKFGHNEGNLVRWALVDDKGHYEFRVGPGTYMLHLPNTNFQTRRIDVKVAGQPELVYDANAARPDQLRIRGRVVKAGGKAVAGAIIYGEPIGPTGYAQIEARADDQGRFSIVRMSDTEKYGFYARAPEADLAGVAIVSSSASDVTVELHLAATAVGFVYDTQGKPVAGEKVTAILGCSDEGCTSINADAVTDKSGHYRIPALAVGSRCSICLSSEHVSVASVDIKLDRPGEISARDIVLPAKGAAAAPEAGQLHPVSPPSPAATSESRKAPAADLTFTGAIRDEATGKPIPAATVVVRRMILNPSPDKHREILDETRHTTDAAGHFTFTIRKEHVSNRRTYIELDAAQPRYVAKTGNGYSLNMILKNIEMGERPFFEDFRLSPGKTLTGFVAAPGGAPLADVLIESYYYYTDPSQFGDFRETQTDKSGRFRMTVPAAGGAASGSCPRTSRR